MKPIAARPIATPAEHKENAPKPSAALRHVAVEFESVLLKQLLTSAHALGKQNGGYADMALDALSGGIAKAGGIGLATAIEHMIDSNSRLKVTR
jgi:Rod binding domain-containing protein